MFERKPIRTKAVLCLLGALLIASCIPLKIGVSPDGRLVIRGKDSIVVTRPDGSGWRTFLKDGEREFHFAEWSPDGKAIALSGQKKDPDVYFLSILDPATGKDRILVEHSELIWLPEWSPDGKAVSYTVEEKGKTGGSVNLKTVDLKTGAIRIMAKSPSLTHAWSPDGTKIATGISERSFESENFELGTLDLVNVASQKSTHLAGLLFWPYMKLSFSPDGKVLYFSAPSAQLPIALTGREEKERLFLHKVKSAVFAYSFPDKKIARITSAEQDVVYFAFSPDQKHFLFVDISEEGRRKESLLQGNLYVARADGSGKKKIGRNHEMFMPVWADASRVLMAEPQETDGDKLKPVTTVNISTGEKAPLAESIQKLFQ